MSQSTETRRSPALPTIFLLFAAELLLTLFIQLPAVADFQKFGFYDEGAWLHLDQLFAAGAVPTVDVGYSYGMLPLTLSRAWFAAFGRTPWAFIAFVTICNLLAAWGLARILHTMGASWGRMAAACAMLPLAIFPNAFSLMHPLEMMLIISALAQQARGRYGWALAFATLAVLTKPSMAYVLGLLLLLLAAWLRKGWRVVIPPTAAAIAGIAAAIIVVGLRPAYANLLPLTGSISYQKMHFGIFQQGRDFWLRGGTPLDILHYYLLSPALFWILATVLLWGMGTLAAVRLWRGHSTKNDAPLPARPTDPLILTIAAMHAAFVFLFYAWAGSWTYYSYLPIIGLLVGFRGSQRQRRLLAALVVLAMASIATRLHDGWNRWRGMVRSPEVAGLWIYPDMLAEARQVRTLAQQHRSLFLVNGNLSAIWPEARTPPSWFLSPGIPTAKEFANANELVAKSDVVILYKDYDQNQEAWTWDEFAKQRAEFEEMPLPELKHFRVLVRRNEKP